MGHQQQQAPASQQVPAASAGAATQSAVGPTRGNAFLAQQLSAMQVQYQAACGAQDLSGEERFIYEHRSEINAAATSDVSAGLIAAVLLDEQQRRDAWDSVQDTEARFIIWYEGAIEDFEVAAWGATTGKPVAEQTFGAAQMQPQVVEELVSGGYVPEPQGWSGDELDKSLELLLDDASAAQLIAGRLQQTVDHWRSGDVDIGGRPEILGTLYSLGLTGSSGINESPQPNARGQAIADSIPRMECILALP